MKILLDENLPVKLKFRFSSTITVYTVNDLKWNSLKDGELLRNLDNNHFDALITSDKNIIHQHKITKYTFRFIIIIAPDNQYETLLPLVSAVQEKILSQGDQVVHIYKK
jgi:predicted nuclease of predicted toxin-antitoxin system